MITSTKSSKIYLLRSREFIFKLITFILLYLLINIKVHNYLVYVCSLSSTYVITLMVRFFYGLTIDEMTFSKRSGKTAVTLLSMLEEYEYFLYKGNLYSTILDTRVIYVYKRMFFWNVCIGCFDDTKDIGLYQTKLRNTIGSHIQKDINTKLREVSEANRFKKFNDIE